MSAMIPDLWPDDVTVTTVSTPFAILNYQAAQLARRTKGTLQGHVQTRAGQNGKKTEHAFDVVVPALNRYHYRLFRVYHDAELAYPAAVQVDEDEIVEAPTEAEFLDTIGKVLRSTRIRSVLHSLIARVNEVQAGTPSS